MSKVSWLTANPNESLQPNYSEFPLLPLLQKAVAVQQQASTKHTVVLSVESELPNTIVGDQDKLDQILTNILNNAIKYSRCNIIQLFITQQDRHLKMVIQDNGKGFNEAEIKKGNGLNNIYKRSKEIKGNATIESGKGRGTRVDVMIKLS